MDYELLTVIKQEKEEFIENNNDLNLSYTYEISVKNENESFEEWCAQNALPEYQEAMSYEELNEKCTVICHACNELFSDRFSLYKHNLEHLQVPLYKHKLYACNYCLYYYENKSYLENHMLKQHTEKQSNINSNAKTHRCKICNKQFTYKNWFEHVHNVHSSHTVTCEECNVKFKCEKYLKRHQLYVHGDAKPSWRYHTIKTEEVDIKCPQCNSKFNNKYSVTQHIRNVHSNTSFTCKICKSTLKSKPYLNSHMQRVHYNDGKSHNCVECGKKYRSPRYLKIHIKNAHSDKVKKPLKKPKEK